MYVLQLAEESSFPSTDKLQVKEDGLVSDDQILEITTHQSEECKTTYNTN